MKSKFKIHEDEDYLLLKLEGGIYAIKINEIKEVVSLRANNIKQFTSTMHQVVGVAKIREDIVTLIDLSTLIDGQGASLENGVAKVILVGDDKSNGKKIGLMVKDVLDVCKIPRDSIIPALGMPDYITGFYSMNEELITVLDVKNFLKSMCLGDVCDK